MPGFHRPPEWQQPADRHTRLIDPVLTVRQLSRLSVSLKHVVRIDHALVFSTPRGGYEGYLPPRRPTRSEIVAHRYTAVYEVDMGVHPFADTLALPSDDDAFEFTTEVDMAWQVLDPARFVASGIRDVPATLVGELQQAARPVTRCFAITDSAAAEKHLLGAVTVIGPLGAPAGLQVTWTLRVRRDEAGIEHQQRLQAIAHTAVEQIHMAQQGMQVDVETAKRDSQQDQLQLARAMTYGRAEQELALQHQQWQHQRAVLQGQQELELQRLQGEKIAFYQWHLAQGGVQAWALHLAQHPEDSQLVMHNMREDQLLMIHNQMELVKELLGGESAEKFELEGPKQLALRAVTDILSQRLPGVPQNPSPFTPPASAGDEPSVPSRQTPPPGGPQPPGAGASAPVSGTKVPPPGPSPYAQAPSSSPYAYPQVQPPYVPKVPQAPSTPPPMPYAPSTTPYAPPPSPNGSPPAGQVPAAPNSWQPPPGYGTTPNLSPPQPPAPAQAESPAPATAPPTSAVLQAGAALPSPVGAPTGDGMSAGDDTQGGDTPRSGDGTKEGTGP